MPWPFSRNETEPTDNDAAEGNRRAGARDPAAELRAQTRRRLIGAAALLAGAVIVLPMVLDTSPKPVRDDISITVVDQAPPKPAPVDRAPKVDEKAAEPAPGRSDPPPVEASPKPAKAAQPASVPTPPARPPASAQSDVASATDRFAVQVAALSTSAAAGDLVARLKKDGFTAHVETVTTGGSTLHRVRVGPFASRDEAQRAAEKMKAAGFKASVVGG